MNNHLLISLKISIAIFCAFLAITSECKEVVSEEEAKAKLLESLIDHINWPVSKSRYDIKLCILGNDPFIVHLKRFNFEVKQKNSYLDDCYIIYVSSLFQGNFNLIQSRVNNKPILTISDINNFLDFGGILEFFIKSNKVVLKVNLSSLKESDLEISPAVLNMMEIN